MTQSKPQAVALLLLTRLGSNGIEVLLGRKLRGFGQGKIVAPGGKIEPLESAQAAARREFLEETGLIVEPEQVHYQAKVCFRFPANPRADMDCAVFASQQAHGKMQRTDELEPLWVLLDALPEEQMWQDSPLWLPRILAGERLCVTVVLNADNETVHQITFSDLC